MSLYTGEGLPGVEDGESWVVLGLPVVVSGMLSWCVLIVVVDAPTFKFLHRFIPSCVSKLLLCVVQM